ncbi:hypothetical protein FHR89_002636 [Cellulomonas uda]|nr:hypothetical protein [Cellulomonas uda]
MAEQDARDADGLTPARLTGGPDSGAGHTHWRSHMCWCQKSYGTVQPAQIG